MAIGRTIFNIDADRIECKIEESPRDDLTFDGTIYLIAEILRDGIKMPIEVKRIENNRFRVVRGFRRFLAIQFINNRVSFRTSGNFLGKIPVTIVD